MFRLIDLPDTEIKLDRRFVSNCAADQLKRTICRSVVGLVHRLNARVCAEGVRTKAELSCLIRLGFDSAQGFPFAKPMPLAGLIAFAQEKGIDSERVTSQTTQASLVSSGRLNCGAEASAF